MDIKLLLKELTALRNLVKNLNEIESLSALDHAIIKKRVENLYEYVIEDYFTDTGSFSSTPASSPDERPIEYSRSAVSNPSKPSTSSRIAESDKQKKDEEASVFFFEKKEDEKNSSIDREQERKPREDQNLPSGITPRNTGNNGNSQTESDEAQEESLIERNEKSFDLREDEGGESRESLGRSTAHNPDLEKLFEIKQGKELSERLSATPVKDILKAMGLNERIFTQNELFGGNTEEFQQVIEKLNNFTAFAEAKTYLKSTVASRYEWHDVERREIAQNFIQLVNRRYKERI